MGVLDWLLVPEPQVCPAPVELPDWWNDKLKSPDQLPPPLPDPTPPTPSTAALLALAITTAAAITATLRDDDDCEEGCEKCIPAHAGTGGIPPHMPYANQRTSRVGYEYQHHVVNWFYHDPAGRIIMEWQFNGIWFDGLDSTRGTLLAGRGIQRTEYDPAGASRCYLIDTKYGYDSWVRYDAWNEKWDEFAPRFLWEGLETEIEGQHNAFRGSYPNVMLVWIFSGSQFKGFADQTLLAPYKPKVATAYFAYIAQEDR